MGERMTRYCDNGCGYKLPDNYAPTETTCGACLDNPPTETPTQQGRRHGSEYADYTWQLDPADYALAVEWCATADAGNLATEYGLPENYQDAMPADLNTEGWSWGELADYQYAWEDAYYQRITELCHQVIEQVSG
jgi:hypothetical protein